MTPLQIRPFDSAGDYQRMIDYFHEASDELLLRMGVLDKLGFRFVKKYRTTPGPVNFEQGVNQYEIDRASWDKLELSRRSR